ncbi:outer membrane beta-barrel protein [Cetobacterium sp. 2A]|uniref:outer membrane beta-barrel protein n=1 Tax=Cetobacterium sp. 2A TaxID=2754723 RepID=UPI00163B74A7|nr:outer membrane beta-barrel protein [Cetobacterium sp. 2A]MBC2856993.1 outer membrane beta-barrel protein [Cetobacterium sp. 2A]
MKKISIFLLLGTLSTLSLAAGNLNVRVGGDVKSKIGSLGSYSDGDTEDYGYEIGLEYMKPITERLELGIGLAYQKHAKVSGNKIERSELNGLIESEFSKGYNDFQGYDSIPVYLTGKYTLNNNWLIKPYLKASLGYSFNFGNEDLEYSDDVQHENELTDTDLGGEVFESYKLSTKIKNGLYYSAGLGLEYRSLSLETLYQVNNGKLSVGNKDYDADYEKISLILNYKI